MLFAALVICGVAWIENVMFHDNITVKQAARADHEQQLRFVLLVPILILIFRNSYIAMTNPQGFRRREAWPCACSIILAAVAIVLGGRHVISQMILRL
jgi:anaerobic C4-dicarboxylate transporter